MFARKSIISFLLVISSGVIITNAQQNINLKHAEDSLVMMIGALISEQSQSKKIELNKQFKHYFQSVLERNGSFDYPFDSLTNIGKLKSSDGLVKIFTWNIPVAGSMHEYHGFIQVKTEEGIAKLYPLSDKREKFEIPQLEVTGPEKWFGALYYYLHENRDEENTYYTLLGVDLNNLFSKKRVIEILTINNEGNPIFGYPIISVRNHMISRIVFEYSSQANMILRYDDNMGMIVFDHLVPFRNDFIGNYQFYGPDLTYDALKFDQGKWIYTPNVDIRNPLMDKATMPIEPPEENPEPGFLYQPLKISSESIPAEVK